jgi:hypothetical protein
MRACDGEKVLTELVAPFSARGYGRKPEGLSQGGTIVRRGEQGIAELERDLDAAQHLLHEIVNYAFRREHGLDPASKAEYRVYHRKLYEEACAAMAMRTEAPEWLAGDDE